MYLKKVHKKVLPYIYSIITRQYMKRTKLRDRPLPTYSKPEELLHSLSHAVGAVFGVIVLILCVIKAASVDAWSVVGAAIYGASMILLYSASCVYHAVKPGIAKQVMRIIDHSTINLLIAGTYTPILLSAIRPVSSMWAWIIFAVVWGFGIIAAVLTSIDLKNYSKFAMACYIGMGWSIFLAGDTVLKALPIEAFIYLLLGGVAYTIGAIIYGVGKKHRYFHFIFHLFALLGSVLQFICVYFYVI